MKKAKMKNRLANNLEWLPYCPIFPRLSEAVNAVNPSDPDSSLMTTAKPAKYTVIQGDAGVTFSDERQS